MAKKKQNYNNANKKQETKPVKRYVNPANRVWGKIIIAILALAMAFGGLATLIYLIVQAA